MKILITGIHGFIGGNLADHLCGRHEIYGLSTSPRPMDGVVKIFSWSDLDSPEALPEFDAIIHLAALAHDIKKASGAEEYFRVNTGLTAKVYDYFLGSKARRFIFLSSVKAAADSIPSGVLTEEAVPSPAGPYGESKLKAEEYIRSKSYAGKSAYILRPCMIHGPGNKGNLNMLYGVARRGIPWPLAAFDNSRSFTSIANLSRVVDGLLESDIPSGTYNVADDTPLSTNELIRIICQVVGRTARLWRLPKPAVRFAAKVGDALSLPLNSERLIKLTENYVVSNAKIKAVLGLKQMPVPASEGLAQTIKSFDNQTHHQSQKQ